MSSAIPANDPERIAQLLDELQQAGVHDARVLEVLRWVPRQIFMADAFKGRAYENLALPIGYHQTISQPEAVGLMTQELQVGDRMKVLEIGTGSGYQAAVLSRLCRRLYTIERHRPLHELAVKRFERLRIRNVSAVVGDGTLGWPDQAPFDRIMVTAAAHDIPPQLVEQLAVGGLMVLPVGEDEGSQRIVRVTRTEEGAETEFLTGTRFVPLIPESGAY